MYHFHKSSVPDYEMLEHVCMNNATEYILTELLSFNRTEIRTNTKEQF
jgi:hypothetical protein